MSGVFYYEVMFSGGNTSRGVMVTPYERVEAASVWIEKRTDGIVVSLRRVPAGLSQVYRWGRSITRATPGPKDVAGMMRDVAVMVSSGIPMLEAVRTLAEDDSAEANKAITSLSRLMMEDLGAGASVTEAFARQSEIFPESVRSLVAIGDASGTMAQMLQEAADHLDRVINMKADAKQAMIYPAFSFLAIFGAAAFWIVYVMPSMVDLFKQMNAKLPPLTVAVLAGAEWLNKHWILVVGLMVSTLVALVWFWKASRSFRRIGYIVLHKLPISRVLVTSSGLAFLAEYLAILTRSGLDVVSSLRILERSTPDIYYEERLTAIRLFVERGDRISSAMRLIGGFPNLMVRMIAVGEDSGTLDNQLSYLAAEYGKRLKQTVAVIAEIIKPLVVVIAGGVFLVLIIALLLPVYDLVRQAMARPM
ncbi:type II secretion system F family protein [Hydrogenophaga sp.]|jgi:type II secretory pathway component PulF|uniref:type II secretion system F family protein n=1 Tax=Hydrogenophaga sp. TaxID=1904254 RepID=UPI003F6EE63A